MCLLECTVCGGITAVVLSRSRSLYLTLCGSLWTCLLYTSDAADDMQCVDLGGWQIYWIMFFIDVIITFFLAHKSLQLSLRGSVMEMLVMSMYWSMLSSTALVCIVDLTSIVDLICVCWNVTYVEELLP